MEKPTGESHVEKLSPSTKKAVAHALETLRGEGYEFTVRETSDEYIFGYKGREYHFEKMEKMPLQGEHGPDFQDLAKVIEQRMRAEMDLL